MTLGETKFSDRSPVCQKGRNREIAYPLTLLEINFEDVGAVLGKGQDGFIGYLLA